MKKSLVAVAGALALAAVPAPALADPPMPAEEPGCTAGHVPASTQGHPFPRSRTVRATRIGDAYVWHNRRGWHLRVRHKGSDKVTFTGTIRNNDGKPITARAFKLEAGHGDTFSLSPDKTELTFTFNNFGGLDGLDLNLACSASTTWSLSVGGSLMNPDRIHLGRRKIEAFSNPLTIERRH